MLNYSHRAPTPKRKGFDEPLTIETLGRLRHLEI